jgi:hypothetical protein
VKPMLARGVAGSPLIRLAWNPTVSPRRRLFGWRVVVSRR